MVEWVSNFGYVRGGEVGLGKRWRVGEGEGGIVEWREGGEVRWGVV